MPKLLTDEEVVILRTAHRNIKDRRLTDRIKAILSLKESLGENDNIYFADSLLILNTTTNLHMAGYLKAKKMINTLKPILAEKDSI